MAKRYRFETDNLKYLRSDAYGPDRVHLFNVNDTASEAVKAFFNILKNAIIYEGTGCYLVTGYRGTGKSSLVNAAIEAAKDQPYRDTTPLKEKKIKAENSPETKEKKVLVLPMQISVGDSPTSQILLRRLLRSFTQVTLNQLDEDLLSYVKSRSFFLKWLDKWRKIPLASEQVQEAITDTIDELQLARSRTFNTVTRTENDDQSQTISASRSFGFEAAKFFPWLTSLVTFLGLTFNYSTLVTAFNDLGIKNNAWIAILIIIGGLIYFLTSSYNLSRKIERSSARKQSLEVKTLYDDEIAETNLLDLMKKMQKALPDLYQRAGKGEKTVRVVCVIDEIDKVEDSQVLTEFLPKLKNILLGGQALFVLVAGKQTYFDTFMATRKEDDILSSLFTQYMSVPVFSPVEARNLYKLIIPFETLPELALHEDDTPVIIEQKQDEKEQIGLFCSKLNFQSRGMVRRFLAEYRRHVYWEDNNCFLEIPDLRDYNPLLYLALELVIYDMLEKYLKPRPDLDEGIYDFLLVQLYIYLSRMLEENALKPGTPFQLETLLDTSFLVVGTTLEPATIGQQSSNGTATKTEGKKTDEVKKDRNDNVQAFRRWVEPKLRETIQEMLETLADMDRHQNLGNMLNDNSLQWLNKDTRESIKQLKAVLNKNATSNTWSLTSFWHITPQTVISANVVTTPLTDESRAKRRKELEQLLEDSYQLLNEYDERITVESDPLERAKFKSNQEVIQQYIKQYEDEIDSLDAPSKSLGSKVKATPQSESDYTSGLESLDVSTSPKDTPLVNIVDKQAVQLPTIRSEFDNYTDELSKSERDLLVSSNPGEQSLLLKRITELSNLIKGQFDPNNPNAKATIIRLKTLYEELTTEAFKFLSEYENLTITSTDPMEIARVKLQVERLNQLINRYEQELKYYEELSPKEPSAPPDSPAAS